MFNGKTHYRWPFSIAMSHYQRVVPKSLSWGTKAPSLQAASRDRTMLSHAQICGWRMQGRRSGSPSQCHGRWDQQMDTLKALKKYTIRWLKSLLRKVCPIYRKKSYQTCRKSCFVPRWCLITSVYVFDVCFFVEDLHMFSRRGSASHAAWSTKPMLIYESLNR